MAFPQPTVFVIDDDSSVRQLVTDFLEKAGCRVLAFGSAEEFLNSGSRPSTGCLVVDLNLPELNGLQLQARVSAEGTSMKFVFITGAGDVATTVQAMKAGAVDFLTKPLDRESLIEAVHLALEQSRKVHEHKIELTGLRERLAGLTKREAEVLRFVATGLLNKQVAAELGIAEKTVKVHRGRIMKKLHARSFADLLSLAQKAGLAAVQR